MGELLKFLNQAFAGNSDPRKALDAFGRKHVEIRRQRIFSPDKGSQTSRPRNTTRFLGRK